MNLHISESKNFIKWVMVIYQKKEKKVKRKKSILSRINLHLLNLSHFKKKIFESYWELIIYCFPCAMFLTVIEVSLIKSN